MSPSARSPWQRWRGLDPASRKLRLEAVLCLARARIQLARRPIAEILANLGSGASSSVPTAASVEVAVARAVASAGARVPWRSDCLLQAMAASTMLRKRSIPSHVCLGVRRAGDGSLEAHAWLVANGGIVTGVLPDLAEFSVIPVDEFARFNATLRTSRV